MKKKNTSWIWIVVTLVVIGGIVAFLAVEGNKPGKYDSFAEKKFKTYSNSAVIVKS